ncbi:MAG: N-acetylmuramoyl-L-alanine amidase [Magnetococcales bacterium]|nr:N-acetylmuramoyl-L-alanine amidase [Magnetococcales bacterium]
MFPFSFSFSEEMSMIRFSSIETMADGLRIGFTITGDIVTRGFLLDRPHRAVLDFIGAPMFMRRELTEFHDPLVKKVRFGLQTAINGRLVFDLWQQVRIETTDTAIGPGKREWTVWLKRQETGMAPATASSVQEPVPATREMEPLSSSGSDVTLGGGQDVLTKTNDQRSIIPPETEERKPPEKNPGSSSGDPPGNQGKTVLTVTSLRQEGETIDITFVADGTIRHRAYTLESPKRGVVDLFETSIANSRELTLVHNDLIRRIRIGHPHARGTRIVFDCQGEVQLEASLGPAANGVGNQLFLRLRRDNRIQDHPASELSQAQSDQQPANMSEPVVMAPSDPPKTPSAAPSATPTPTPPVPPSFRSFLEPPAPGKQSLPFRTRRAYEAFMDPTETIIMVDPGHGGIDPGAVGREGTLEKDVTLAVARRLFHKLNGHQNCKVVLTRNEDRFLTLRQRVALARRARADLFLSLHADAYRDPAVHGASVFCLTDGVQYDLDEKDRLLAQRENAASDIQPVNETFEHQDSLMELLQMDAIKKLALADSVQFGRKLIQSLRNQPGIGVHYPRVKRVNFLVLKNPGIPSSLVEMGFLSNLRDERRMVHAEYQDMMAEGLASGICKFFRLAPTDKA